MQQLLDGSKKALRADLDRLLPTFELKIRKDVVWVRTSLCGYFWEADVDSTWTFEHCTEGLLVLLLQRDLEIRLQRFGDLVHFECDLHNLEFDCSDAALPLLLAHISKLDSDALPSQSRAALHQFLQAAHLI